MISWMIRKKDTIALSSVEVEYITACEAVIRSDRRTD